MLASIETVTAPQRHIFLSPHYDDIALSAGGVAALLSANGRTPEIILIFGDHPDPNVPLTKFADDIHRDWGLSAEGVVASRRQEEAVASLTLGACDRYLPFRDAIYRGDQYQHDSELFGTPKPGDAELPGQIRAALPLSDNDRGHLRVYAPLAVGHHVDHQLAFQTGLEMARDGWEVWFYEDLPYSLKPANQESRHAELRELQLAPAVTVDVSVAWTRKIDAIMAYPSQLPTIFEQYVGIGSTREAIDEAMADYAEGVGSGIRSEEFWTLNG
jgi:LmbE family N-acetylglucosaminyl deacetylase